MRKQVEDILKRLHVDYEVSLSRIHRTVQVIYDIGEADLTLNDGRKITFLYDAEQGRLRYRVTIRKGGTHDRTQNS